MEYTLNTEKLTAVEQEALLDLLLRHVHGGHTIDIVTRKDGKETWFQGDWLKHLKVKIVVERREVWQEKNAL